MKYRICKKGNKYRIEKLVFFLFWIFDGVENYCIDGTYCGDTLSEFNSKAKAQKYIDDKIEYENRDCGWKPI